MIQITTKIHFPRALLQNYIYYFIWIMTISLIIYGSNWDFTLEGPGNEFVPFFLLPLASFIITWPWFSYFNLLGSRIASQQPLHFSHQSKMKFIKWGVLWPGIPLSVGIVLVIVNVTPLLFVSYFLFVIFVGAYTERVPFFLLNDKASFFASVRSASNIGKSTYLKNLILYVAQIIAGSCLLVFFFLMELSIVVVLNIIFQDVLKFYFETLLIVLLGMSLSLISTLTGFIKEKSLH
ncbi:MAG: hypothetical protein EAX86_06950 [Candidatus Heimdallarchaeota archaeon]|nr:hypothetical protein [Candidatus Heimdallarchaeota archaeon]